MTPVVGDSQRKRSTVSGPREIISTVGVSQYSEARRRSGLGEMRISIIWAFAPGFLDLALLFQPQHHVFFLGCPHGASRRHESQLPSLVHYSQERRSPEPFRQGAESCRMCTLDLGGMGLVCRVQVCGRTRSCLVDFLLVLSNPPPPFPTWGSLESDHYGRPCEGFGDVRSGIERHRCPLWSTLPQMRCRCPSSRLP